MPAFRQAPYFIWHEPGKTTLASWQADHTVILALLRSLREAGAGGVALAPFVNHPDPAQGIPFGFDWTPVWRDIQARDLYFVQIAPQFYGDHDPRAVGMAALDDNWNFIASLKSALDQSGLLYLIDVCPEVNSGWVNPDQTPNAGFQQYVQTLWINSTATAAPGGAPCWQYTMSFTGSQDLSMLPVAFQANPPAILAPHLYSNELGGFPDSISALRNILSGVGFSNALWMLTETDSLEAGIDDSIALELNRGIIETRQLVLGVCPWPVTPRTPETASSEPACIPPIYSHPWNLLS